MGSKKIGFPKNGKDGEEGLCRADLVLKQLECMGEGMTDGPTEGAEPERVEKGFGLVSDSGGAVLKIFIVEAESRIDPDGVNPCMDSTVDFAAKVVEQGGGVIRRVDEIPHGADILPLDVTENDAGTMLGNGTVKIIGGAGAGKVEDGSSCLQTPAGDFGLIGFDGDQRTLPHEGFQDGKKSGNLPGRIHPGGVVEGRLSAEIDEVSPFRVEATSTENRGLGACDDTFSVPGVGTQVDDTHQVGAMHGTEGVAANFEFSNFGRQVRGMFAGKLGDGFDRKHAQKDT